MSFYSEVAIAIDSADYNILENKINAITKPYRLHTVKTPDNNYFIFHWDGYNYWGEDEESRNLEKTLNSIRHSFIKIDETGNKTEHFLEEDDKGCDGEFSEILSWETNITVFDEPLIFKKMNPGSAPISEYDIGEFIGQIIDIFEDFLTDRKIKLFNQEVKDAIAEGEDPKHIALFKQGEPVFRLYPDDTEGAVTSIEEIEHHDSSGGLFGLETA